MSGQVVKGTTNGTALAASPRLTVSNSEGRLLHLLADGCSNAQIALRVGRPEKTVRNRLSLLYQKLGVPNRAAAVAVWVRDGEMRLSEPLSERLI